MTVQEVADKLVSLCREGKHAQAIEELYADNIVSVEPDGAPVKVLEGKQAVIEKGKRFEEMVETMHSSVVSDPVVGGDFFSCAMKMNVTFKGAPMPIDMEEICVYLVENGKISREEFFFKPMVPHA